MKQFLNKSVQPCLAIFIGLIVLTACETKAKKNLSTAVDATVKDLIVYFDDVKLPKSFSDSIFLTKITDTNRIDYSLYTRLITDSVLVNFHGKDKPTIIALGKFNNPDAETYLLYRSKGKASGLFLSAINENNVPKATMQLLGTAGQSAAINEVVIDQRFTITLSDKYKASDGSTLVYSSVYAYNNEGLFMEIMNDGLKQGEKLEVNNPIDTLPQKMLHSGDYGTGPRNFICVRDHQPNRFAFFIFSDKNNCVSELKGEGVWVNKDSAYFQSTSDNCVIGFKFSEKSVKINEQEGCSGRRQSTCSFNATYSSIKFNKKKNK